MTGPFPFQPYSGLYQSDDLVEVKLNHVTFEAARSVSSYAFSSKVSDSHGHSVKEYVHTLTRVAGAEF
jgi:hypothetical protein